MTKRSWILLLVAVLIAVCSADLDAQSRSRSKSKKEKKKEKEKTEKEATPIKDRIWYGFGPQLGFSGGQGYSVFTLGVAPMAGFKIIPAVSIGPRASMVFNNYKFTGYKATWFVDAEIGGFVRAKVFQGLFFQGEWGNQWQQFPFFGATDKLGKVSVESDNKRLGAGWNNSSGGWGSELGVFYNFDIANDVNSYYNPFEFRFNFTYKF
jgi:hypothetical protein